MSLLSFIFGMVSNDEVEGESINVCQCARQISEPSLVDESRLNDSLRPREDKQVWWTGSNEPASKTRKNWGCRQTSSCSIPPRAASSLFHLQGPSFEEAITQRAQGVVLKLNLIVGLPFPEYSLFGDLNDSDTSLVSCLYLLFLPSGFTMPKSTETGCDLAHFILTNNFWFELIWLQTLPQFTKCASLGMSSFSKKQHHRKQTMIMLQRLVVADTSVFKNISSFISYAHCFYLQASSTLKIETRRREWHPPCLTIVSLRFVWFQTHPQGALLPPASFEASKTISQLQIYALVIDGVLSGLSSFLKPRSKGRGTWPLTLLSSTTIPGGSDFKPSSLIPLPPSL